MPTEEHEPIFIALPTSGRKVQLSPAATARVWSAVRRGEANSPEEFITRAFDQWLEKQELPQAESKGR